MYKHKSTAEGRNQLHMANFLFLTRLHAHTPAKAAIRSFVTEPENQTAEQKHKQQTDKREGERMSAQYGGRGRQKRWRGQLKKVGSEKSLLEESLICVSVCAPVPA